jgi:hypothetical protein
LPTFTARESDGVALAGDSIVITTPTDYKVWVWVAATTSNVNDQIRLKMYVNSLPLPTSLGRFIINSNGVGVYLTDSYMWYRSMLTGDRISFYVTNLTGNRTITIADFKIYVEKVPEK